LLEFLDDEYNGSHDLSGSGYVGLLMNGKLSCFLFFFNNYFSIFTECVFIFLIGDREICYIALGVVRE